MSELRLPAFPYFPPWTKADRAQWPGYRDTGDPTHEGPAIDELIIPALLEKTQFGNAARFIARHGHEAFWVPSHGWHFWDGDRWARDSDGAIARMAMSDILLLRDLAEQMKQEGWTKWALKSESAFHVKAIRELAKSLRFVDYGGLDTDPAKLNVLNGTIDLRTGSLNAHDPHDLITRLAPVEYMDDAPRPAFDAFLRQIFNEDDDLIQYVQRALGYALVGGTQEQVVFFLYGKGANGKSTLIELVHGILGEYAAKASIDTFMEQRPGAINNQLAALAGVRFVSSSESDIDRRLAEGLVKGITGTDTQSARFLYQEFFSFLPQFTVMVATNHLPDIQGRDHGIWRRIKVIPFNVTIPDVDRDPNLLEKLRSEAAGVFAWLVEGAVAWHQQGLQEPESIRSAVTEYRTMQDPIGRFISEECTQRMDASASSHLLHARYVEWAETQGIQPCAPNLLGRRLKEEGFVSKRQYVTGNQERYWQGIEVKREEDL